MVLNPGGLRNAKGIDVNSLSTVSNSIVGERAEWCADV